MTEDDVYIETFDTLDEAIAVCRALSKPGDEIAIHSEDCEIDEDDEGCTCEPLIVTCGELPSA